MRKPRATDRHARAVRVGAVAVAVAVVCVACGGDDGPTEREYSLPDTLCGLDVSQELYAPLFPPGSELSVTEFPSDPLASLDQCEISVDGDLLIRAETSGVTELEPYAGDHDVTYELDQGTTVDGEFEALAWPGSAAAHVSCAPGAVIHAFNLGIRADFPEEDEESRRVLSELIQPLMAAAVEASVCEPAG